MADKKFQVKGTKSVLLEQLARLKMIDIQTEWQRKKWGWIAGLSGLMFFLSLFLIAPLLANFGNDKSSFIFLPVFFISFVVGLINYIRNKSKDLEDRKLESATKLVQFLGDDIPPTAECQLMVDFSDYCKGATLVSKNKKLLGPDLFVYNHKWLTFAGKLFDGNKFELEIEQDIKRKEVPKRKYKKVKENIRESATLRLKFNPEFYPEPSKVAEKINKGASPYGFKVNSVLGTDKSLKVTMSTNPVKFLTDRVGRKGDEKALINGDKLLGLFMLTYEALKTSQQAA